MILNTLCNEILAVLKMLGIQAAEKDIQLEHPADLKFGDYSTNIALQLGKKHNRDPKELAAEIAKQILKQNNKILDKIEVAGPGFVNFYLSAEVLCQEVDSVLSAGDKYGAGSAGGQKVLVEYSSPNIAKPFTIGHLRSTIIGDAIANISAFSGNQVIRDNHLGDWGTQFGKQIVAIKKWGDENAIEKSKNPVKELVALYVKFHEEAEKDPGLEDLARAEFLKLEQGDAEAKRLWQKCIDWSLKEFNILYEKLGVKFDTIRGESMFAAKSGEVYRALDEKSLMHKSDGADLVFFAGDKYPPLMVRKQDGSSIYATRDLGADLARREEYGEGLQIINEAGSEQELYFKQLFETEYLLGWYRPGERVHVAHGLYRFVDGKMSTRKGNVIWLEEVIAEAVKRAAEFNPAVAEDVGIGALKYNDLKRESAANITFDWNDVLNLKGNSGPYLQYTYARTQSVLEKAEKEGIKAETSATDELSLLERLLYRFPEVVARAAGEYAPHHIATFLYELANAFNSYYADHQIVSKESNSPYRIALTAAVGQVLENGLHLLGIKTPAKM
jgi:arginyl-tRNA synthetase